MYLYSLIQEEHLDKYGVEKESVMLCNLKKYSQTEFEKLLRDIGSQLRKNRRYVEINLIVNELIPYGFKKIGFTAEADFVLEIY